MVYNWIESDNQKRHIFKKFIKELNEVLMYDSQIINRNVDAKAKLFSMKKIISDFKDQYEYEKDNLKLFQDTSIEQMDYLEKIGEIIISLKQLLDEINLYMDAPIYLKKLLMEIAVYSNELEINIRAMQEQAKQSLEFLYEAGENKVSIEDFITCVNKIGGRINNNHGHGDHFYVEFALFNHVMAPSKIDHSEVSLGSLNSLINDNLYRIEKVVDPKYMKCYFFKKNHEFRKIFIHKYKKHFQLNFSNE